MPSHTDLLGSEARYTIGLNIPSDLSVTLVIVEKGYLAKEAGGVIGTSRMSFSQYLCQGKAKTMSSVSGWG